MKIFAGIFLLLLSLQTQAADSAAIPEGFVLQRLEETDGQIVRPKDWYFTSKSSSGGWTWSISKEEPIDGHYLTGMKIQLLAGITTTTGQSREDFVKDFVEQKKKTTKVLKDCSISDIEAFHRKCLEFTEIIETKNGPVEFHILYSLMWGKKMDLVVVTIFGTPTSEWSTYSPTMETMREFVLIGPKFAAEK